MKQRCSEVLVRRKGVFLALPILVHRIENFRHCLTPCETAVSEDVADLPCFHWFTKLLVRVKINKTVVECRVEIGILDVSEVMPW